jgi:hypothetical protein
MPAPGELLKTACGVTRRVSLPSSLRNYAPSML